MNKSVAKVVGNPHNLSSGTGAPSGESRGKITIKGCDGYAKRMGYGTNGTGGPHPGSKTNYTKSGKMGTKPYPMSDTVKKNSV